MMQSGGAKSDSCPTKVEEEAVKRNTDCVYFLASPLTCKKGIECEYRHSEGARVNPRDCRFWFTGNCLNPKCLFRHPPLDGLFGNAGSTPGPVATSYQATQSLQLPTGTSSAYDLSKNHVPCYYFQKGACLKGDKCLFMHGPWPAVNPVTKHTSKCSTSVAAQSETSQKGAWEISECRNQKNSTTSPNISNEIANKPTNVVPFAAKGYTVMENSNHKRSSHLLPHRFGSHIAGLPFKTSTSFPQYQDSDVQPEQQYLHGEAGEILEESSGVGFTETWKPPVHPIQNGKGAEEVLRETSPGFDVLVDNGVADTDYLGDNDGFSRWSSQGGRNIELEDDEYAQHHSGYEPVRFDRDRHGGMGEHQNFGKPQNRGDWIQHSTSSTSQRVSEKTEFSERRLARRLRSCEEIDASDLRHRLTKQRRLNCSSSTKSGSHLELHSIVDPNNLEMDQTRKSFRDQRRSPESATISSRLRGRITFRRPSSPEKPNVRDTGRQGARLSPVIPPRQYQGRLGGRLSVGSRENHAIDRKSGSQLKTGDTVNPLDFDGPRSLAELKGAKADGIFSSQSTRSNDSSGFLEHDVIKSSALLPDFVVSSSFEGPKPLSVLLKRKREAGFQNGAILDISNNGKEMRNTELGSTVSVAAPDPEFRSEDSHEADYESNEVFDKLDEPSVESVEEGNKEGLIHVEDDHTTYQQQVARVGTGEQDAAGADELEDCDQRYGEYDDYEPEEGGEYQREEEEINHMDVDVDENEEEDDFAKKIGLILSGSNQQGR